ncbi:hypothetical protein DL96DRAFT_117355 [Flagelloscypha sp. PMI_526]|nr:hypothetical protein DL96DRAFT_117355 [Flagelloscypha sp. PMI_526]
MALPSADPEFFRAFFQHHLFPENTDSISTVNTVSLIWLENCATSAASRSAFWDIAALSMVNKRSQLYLENLNNKLDVLKNEPFGLERIAAAKSRLLRSIAASPTLISLPEAAVPLLPAEIIYCIFQFVAVQNVLEAKQISVLSQTVQKWVDPYIFRRIIPLDNSKYTALTKFQTPRLVQAKTKYFVAITLLTASSLARFLRFWDDFPAVRSVSFPVSSYTGLIVDIPVPTLRRLHLSQWNAGGLPLSSQIFSTLTHLSIHLNSDLFHYTNWEFIPLKHLLKLSHLLLHPHTKMPKYPSEVEAGYMKRFMKDNLIPSLPPSLRLLIWDAGTVSRDHSLEAYVNLLDGSMDSRLVLVFQKGDSRLGAREIIEGSRIGSLAYFYPEYTSFESAGLDWLECLWEDIEEFVAKR